jgi:lipopolysaccharide transport system permease protein
MVQLWMYATPTVYSQPSGAELGGWLHTLMALNPMTALIAGFRAAVLGGPMDWAQVGVAAAVSAAAFLGGCLYFRRTEDSFADLI